MQLVAHFGNNGNTTRLLALLGGVVKCLVFVGVELLAVGVELNQAVLGEHLLNLNLSQHQAVVQVLQVVVLACDLLLWHTLCGFLQDVSHLYKVLTEALDS